MKSFTLQVYGYSVPTFGNGVVYDVDQKVRTEQFRWFTEALKKDRLKKYIPMFLMEAEVGACAGPDLALGRQIHAQLRHGWMVRVHTRVLGLHTTPILLLVIRSLQATRVVSRDTHGGPMCGLPLTRC